MSLSPSRAPPRGDELAWWQHHNVDPLQMAQNLWRATYPSSDIGNVLTQAGAAGTALAAAEPAMTVGERRLAALASDGKSWPVLVPQRQTIRLQGGKGEYRAAIPNIMVPGLYRVTVRIRGEDNGLLHVRVQHRDQAVIELSNGFTQLALGDIGFQGACRQTSHKCNLSAEVECGNQSVISPSDFEANAITIKHLRFRGHRPLSFAVSLELVQSDALDNDRTSKTANGRAVLSCASSLDALDVFCIKILPRHFQVVMGL